MVRTELEVGHTVRLEMEPGSSNHNVTKPEGSSNYNVTKPGSSNHNVTKPEGSSNHNVTKRGSSNHAVTKPGSSNHNHNPGSSNHNVTKPEGSSNHNVTKRGSSNHNVTKPDSSNHNHNVTMPGSSHHNHNETKPGSSKHNDSRSGADDNDSRNPVFATPREVVVGGSRGWNYGVDLEEWASKTTFHVGDVLGNFEYNNMTNRRHDVYLQTNLWSYRTCNFESRNKIASSEENGSKESFKFILAMSQPYSFAWGENNGYYCRTYNMKFSVLPGA
ncbi:hypothetical protein HID58_071772 [Brassica napus]|uniref:Phytocyanin domain-containing protein n=1 Tax=Brassica napus TaxID=3708 RepID=A0ABQ7Z2J4_BRANA|nr:hypothetical protein HID58_071772 [Brassica napus]